MKRGQIVFALTSFLWMLGMMVSAQSISEQHAMDRVRDFLKSAPAEGSLRRAMDNVQLKPVTVDVPQVYAFNIDGGGFVIASGDERALPVLGYSTNSQLNWEQMPENMRDWIRSYSEAIQSLSDAKVSTTTRRSYPSAINQLLKTQWGQNSPQNMFCPKYTGGCETYQGQRYETRALS